MDFISSVMFSVTDTVKISPTPSRVSAGVCQVSVVLNNLQTFDFSVILRDHII